jgi:16S rRNA (cytosine967-C5)-methyltransferase
VQARRAALDALGAVHGRDAYANLVLPGLLRRYRLSDADAARATDLTYGTLRGTGTFDAVIEACSNRPLARIDLLVLDALRLGVYQLLATRVPAHAAVSTTVDLVRATSGSGAARFANAVLRQVAEHDLDGWVDELSGDAADPRDVAALRHQHPRWVVDALADALGQDEHRLMSVLAADNVPARVTLAAIPGSSTVADLLAAGAQPGRWASTAAVLPGGNPAALAAVRSGHARVQDEGSQLVTLALAGAPVPGDTGDQRWLDMCSGPGGKATLLAGLASSRALQDGPPHVLAAEIHEHRARLVRSALASAGLLGTAGVIRTDATQAPWAASSFSRVLLDAPCTGLGAVRRRPESRWRRTPGDLDRLVPLQRALLHRAIDSAVDRGVVAYVTCSPHPAETVEVVERVVASRDDVVVEDASALLPDIPDATRGAYLQLWPDLHGTDAMFMALLRRTGLSSAG